MKWDYLRSAILYKIICKEYSDEVVNELKKIIEHMETLDRLEREGKTSEDYF